MLISNKQILNKHGYPKIYYFKFEGDYYQVWEESDNWRLLRREDNTLPSTARRDDLWPSEKIMFSRIYKVMNLRLKLIKIRNKVLAGNNKKLVQDITVRIIKTMKGLTKTEVAILNELAK